MTQPIVPSIVQSAATPVSSGAAAGASPLTASADSARNGTGHPVVDEVLRSLDGVEARALEEQVQVLEAAHARLHAVLADAGDDPSA